MPDLIMCKGLPASGKSTWAKKRVAESPANSIKRVNKDDLRSMLDGGRWSKDSERLVLEMRDFAIKNALEHGQHVIVDDTNLDPKHEKRLREIVKEIPTASFKVKDFTDVTLSECVERDKERDNPVGYEVIRTMYERYLKPKQHEIKKRPYNHELPFAIIVDIDGTLSHNNGHRGWHEYHKVGDDECHFHIRELVNAMTDTYKIILVSGRPDSCMEQTKQWLEDHMIVYDDIFMRKTGDYRNDSIVKKELFDENIEGKYNILFSVDDRDRVVDMWRKELHIPCLQVNYGDF